MEENKNVETFSKTFTGWTEYDDWLIENGQIYSVYDLQEANNVITINYCKREDFKFINNK